MKKFLIIFGVASMLLGVIFLFRGRIVGEENPSSTSVQGINLNEGEQKETDAPTKVPGKVLGSRESDLPCEDLVARFSSAKEKRNWREILRLRRWFASLSSDKLLLLIRHMQKIHQELLLGQMLELAFKGSDDRHFRRELSRGVMSGLEGGHVDTLSPDARREMLHLLAVYGGSDGASKLLSLVGAHEDPEVKQIAALALGKEGSASSVPHLRLMADQVDLDLSGIYAILALQKIGDRAAIQFSEKETAGWKQSLVRAIEFNSDPLRVDESLVVLSRLHDRGTNEMLVSLLKRESSSMELRRKALTLLGKEGTEEFLEDLEGLPEEDELSSEIERARRAIESRRRPH